MADIPVRLRPRAAPPAGWPPDVIPNQIITAAHVNLIRSSVYAWPGDVDGQNHTLSNVHLANATGVLADPTTAPGDLIARGAAAIGRFAIGTAGQVLTVDLTAPAKLKWATPAVAPVLSVFGRVGAVVAQAGDYTVAQVTGALADPLTTKGDLIGRGAAATGRIPAGLDGQILRADASQAFGLRWSGESVPSVFGRTGPVVAQAGDYAAAEVTNAVSTLGSYPDPAWIPSLAWAKLIGTPATFPAAPHTHDAAAIVSGVLATARLGTGVADATVYLRGDGTWAAAGSGGGGGVVSVFGRAGAVVAQAGDYTAAQVTGAVADPTTVKGDLIVRNDLAALVRLPVGATGQVLQADTSLTVGMKWTSITGAVQTPWVTDVDAANFQLINARRIGVAIALPAYPLDVVGDINYTGTLRKNGVAVTPMTDPTTTKGDLIARGAAAIDRLPAGTNGQVLTADSAQALGVKWAAGGGSQTPWTSDIDAAGFNLKSVGKIGINNATPTYTLDARTDVDHRLMLRTPFGGQDGITLMSGNDTDSLFKTLTLEGSNVLLNATSGGFVGIGTISPISLLHVLATVGNPSLAADCGMVNFGATGMTTLSIGQQGQAPYGPWLQAKHSSNTGTAYPLLLNPAGGNVGIGMSNPIQGRLSISGVNTYPPGTADTQSTAGLALIGTTVNTRLFLGLGDAAHNYASWIQATYDNGGGGNGIEGLLLNPLGGVVGVGAPNPQAQLHVTGAWNNPSLSAASGVVTIDTATGPQLLIGMYLTSPYGLYFQGKHSNNGGSNFPILLNPLGGAVGVGTAAPGAQLDVVGNVRASTGFLTSVKGNLFGSPGGGLTALGSGDANILLYYSGTGNWAGIGTDTNGNIWFRTGTSGTPDARVTIGVAGGLGIGVNPISYTLQLATDSAGKPGTNTWAVVSDARTKRNIRPFVEGLATLLRLRPTAYEYNGEAGTPAGLAGVGLVAQEAADVIPACVRWIRGRIAGEETDVMSLNTGDLAFMVLNALRELDARLHRLEVS